MSSQRKKYPRTYHLPWSDGQSGDDKTLTPQAAEEMFGCREVVVTEKLDGENTTIYSDGTTHARSLDSAAHPSRTRVRKLAAQLGPELPPGWRLMGENLYARHSIAYTHLPGYFVLFGIADEDNFALSWNSVEEWAEMLGIPHVPVLWRGCWDAQKIRVLRPRTSAYGPTAEGYVVRVAANFPMQDFNQHVAKYVRHGHVQTDAHWMHSAIVPNGLA